MPNFDQCDTLRAPADASLAALTRDSCPGRRGRHPRPAAARSGPLRPGGSKYRRTEYRAGSPPADRRRPAGPPPSPPTMIRARSASDRFNAFRRATAAAAADRSMPRPHACGNSLKSDSNRQPVPVPRSSTDSGACRSGTAASAASTRVSLSGRGSSVSPVTSKTRLQNSRRPSNCAIGRAPRAFLDQRQETGPVGDRTFRISDYRRLIRARCVRQQQARLTLRLGDAGRLQNAPRPLSNRMPPWPRSLHFRRGAPPGPPQSAHRRSRLDPRR